MRDANATLYRRRKALLVVLLCLAVLVVLCLIVLRTMHTLAPLVSALT